jgi:hypothetical protein
MGPYSSAIQSNFLPSKVKQNVRQMTGGSRTIMLLHQVGFLNQVSITPLTCVVLKNLFKEITKFLIVFIKNSDL